LYKYGGIYLDLDTVCKKEVDDLLHYDFVVARSPMRKEDIRNGFYMVIPKHPFIQYCIEELPKHIHDYSYFGSALHVFYSTGPHFLRDRLKEYGTISNLRILSNAQFGGDCYLCTLDNCKGGEYVKLTIGKTWFQWDYHLYTFGTCHYPEILGGILLATLVGSEYYYWTSNSTSSSLGE
jgi:mannosyltransferase OCH1-like enzyme